MSTLPSRSTMRTLHRRQHLSHFSSPRASDCAAAHSQPLRDVAYRKSSDGDVTVYVIPVATRTVRGSARDTGAVREVYVIAHLRWKEGRKGRQESEPNRARVEVDVNVYGRESAPATIPRAPIHERRGDSPHGTLLLL